MGEEKGRNLRLLMISIIAAICDGMRLWAVVVVVVD
jgi:hypothetical protein